jgi:endonuclease III
VQHPQARYELDWKTPEQLLVAAVLADGSRDAAVNDVTKVLFARWPDTRALVKADVAQLTQVIEPLGLAQQKPRIIAIASLISEAPVRPRAQDGERRAHAGVRDRQRRHRRPAHARVAKRLGLTQADEPDQIERDLMQLLPRHVGPLRCRRRPAGPAAVYCSSRRTRCGRSRIWEALELARFAEIPPVAPSVRSVLHCPGGIRERGRRASRKVRHISSYGSAQ